MRQILTRAAASLAVLLVAVPVQAQIVNGSFTGPIQTASAPPSWFEIEGSVDTMNQNNNVGCCGFFDATPSPSPNGGSWVGFAVDHAYVERFGQVMTGLNVGQTYVVSWYTENFGYSNYNQAGAVGMLIDNVLIGTGATHSVGTQWYLESVGFTATAASQTISFRPYGDGPTYMGMDGVTIAEDTEVAPEPGFVLLATGLGVVGAVTRRKRAQG